LTAAGSSLLLAQEWHAYSNDNCPMPTVECS